MLDDLKYAAEWMGLKIDHAVEKHVRIKDEFGHIVTFCPHQEEGRHWLVMMLRKLDDEQWGGFKINMRDCMPNNIGLNVYWILIAPSEICFKCLMQVIKE